MKRKPTGIDVSQMDDQAAYMRAYRAARPEKHAEDKRRFKTYRQAEQVLRRRHPEEFREIFEALMAGEQFDGSGGGQ